MPIHRVSRGRDETATAGRTTNRRRQRGQTLVEFALVVPLFMGILIAIVEFAFTFNAVLAAQYSSRDAALVAAEAGNADGADCAILSTVEADMGAPPTRATSARSRCTRRPRRAIQIGAATVYARGGAFDCTMPDGNTITLPYTRTRRLPRGRAMQRPRRLRRPRARPRRASRSPTATSGRRRSGTGSARTST